MYLKAQTVSDEALAGCGSLITPFDGPAPEEGEIYSWTTVLPDLGLSGAALLAGRFECRARPIRATRFERHLESPELISAVTGDAIIFLAPPQEPRPAALSGLRAVLVPRGRAILLARGCWHAVPFPAGKENVTLLVVFRDKTGEDDLHFFDMPETVELSL